MTDREKLLQDAVAKGQRAEAAWTEFVALPLEDMVGEYTARIVEIANTELNPAKRSEKLTALSNGIRIAENIRSGLQAAIKDGETAQKELLRARKIEDMTAPQRRLLGLVPTR